MSMNQANLGGGNSGGGGGGRGGNNRRRNYVAEQSLRLPVRPAMQMFKEETAAELGLINYNNMDKGWLASRQNGYVGGNMTKKMVSFAEEQILANGAEVMRNTLPVVEIDPRVLELNQLASQNFQQFQQNLAGIQQGGFGGGMTQQLIAQAGLGQQTPTQYAQQAAMAEQMQNGGQGQGFIQ